MKDDIRKRMLLIRKNILGKKEKSTKIVEKIINLDLYKNAKVIAIYNSLPNEVDTSYLIKCSLGNKIVLLPKVINDKMIFIRVDKNTIYKKSAFKIYEPIGDEYLEKPNLIIVPGIAFDKSLNRLGYGKGYYDKYLGNNNVYKIGVCFENQIIDRLPCNDG